MAGREPAQLQLLRIERLTEARPLAGGRKPIHVLPGRMPHKVLPGEALGELGVIGHTELKQLFIQALQQGIVPEAFILKINGVMKMLGDKHAGCRGKMAVFR
jgi:hypothetical protein